MTARSRSYIIPGTPISITKARNSGKTIWDSQKQIRVNCSCSLETQHNEEPLFLGPVIIQLTFYFEEPPFNTNPNIRKPELDYLVQFIMTIAHDVLFDDNVYIVDISAKKMYDWDARTELIITEAK